MYVNYDYKEQRKAARIRSKYDQIVIIDLYIIYLIYRPASSASSVFGTKIHIRKKMLFTKMYNDYCWCVASGS